MELTSDEQVYLNKLRDLHRAYKLTFKSRGLSRQVFDDLMTATVDEPKMLNLKHPHPDALAVFREGRRSIGQHIRFMLDEKNFTEDAFKQNLSEELKNGR